MKDKIVDGLKDKTITGRDTRRMKRIMMLLFTLSCIAGLAGCGRNGEKVVITEENVVEETLVIEGLTREYDLLFLTDTHMVVSSSRASEQEASYAAERAPGFVDEMGVSSAEQFPGWMTYAAEHQADGVLLGGDVLDMPSAGGLEYLQNNLNTLPMPYLYTLGNHDWTYPWEYMTETGKAKYLPLFGSMMQGNTAIQRLDIGELTIVAVDNSAGQVNGEALQTYQEILAEGRPTIIMVHVPFMTQSVLSRAREVWSSPVVIGAGDLGGIRPNKESTAFIEMTTAADSPVVAVLAGHVHFYDKDYIEGGKDVLQLIGDGGYKRQGMWIHISGEKYD